MSDLDTRAFRRSLTLVLAVLGFLTAGAVVLFGHLLFKALSKDVVNDAILHTSSMRSGSHAALPSARRATLSS